MNFSNVELKRVYELTQWAVEKKNIKDKDFLSAYDKLKKLNDMDADEYRISAISRTPMSMSKPTYGALSDEAKKYIDRRVQEGNKNTYHSIMAVLDNYRKHNSSIDKEDIRRKYIDKYRIDEADMAMFNEIFDTCFEVFSERSDI